MLLKGADIWNILCQALSIKTTASAQASANQVAWFLVSVPVSFLSSHLNQKEE